MNIVVIYSCLYTLDMLRVEDFGRYIRKIRGNIRQKDFAESIGISQNHLSNLETGRREPTISLILLLVEKYGVKPSFWFEDESESSKDNQDKSVDNNLKMLAQKVNAFDELKFSEIHSILSQLYVYLDNKAELLLPSEKRMLSDIFSACQRLIDFNQHQSF